MLKDLIRLSFTLIPSVLETSYRHSCLRLGTMLADSVPFNGTNMRIIKQQQNYRFSINNKP